ncbi:hypothetical protein TNIN_33371 [Trichonephila inaurata madagascariensis]|uniref:Uncharacterized protein n=1 Tax=Trichonephila inaurata madagascariensis TaxID=2747483 RepID=A0A8X7BN99_9ARAC|nr:hypothetical protein TNIN_33371 [Trichonephila inaurata madagascariensis]
MATLRRVSFLAAPSQAQVQSHRENQDYRQHVHGGGRTATRKRGERGRKPSGAQPVGAHGVCNRPHESLGPN